MNTVYTVVKKARLRLRCNRTLSTCTPFLLFLYASVLVLSVVDRSLSVSFIPWDVVWVISGALSLAILVSVWFATTPSAMQVAAEVDNRLDLQDRLGTAISCEQTCTPYGEAAIEDAVSIVAEQNIKALIPKAFPVKVPAEYLYILVLCLVTTGVLWTKQWNLFEQSPTDSNTPTLATDESIEQSIEVVLEQLQNDALLGESLEEELAALSDIDSDNAAHTESLRREALKSITDVQQRLDELMQSEDILAFEEMQQRLQKLDIPKLANMQPLIADLKNGEFSKAKEEFEKLQDELESSELSQAEKEQLKDALESLSADLQALADSKSALSSALASAGLNENLADDVNAALKAVENSNDLTEEQKKQLTELIKSQRQANEMCKKMSQSCSNCSEGKDSSGMASELEKLQAMSLFKKQAEQAKETCSSAVQGMCQGNGEGGGTGGQGNGSGGQNPTSETETNVVAHKTPVETIEGTIIGRQLFEGGLLTAGDSKVPVREEVLAQQRDMEQAIVDEEVPRKYHDVLRHYFGQLEELTEPIHDNDSE